MRLANIIIAHKNPSQLERLIKKLKHPHFDFYIHIDKKVDVKSFEYLADMDGVYFIHNRFKCNWGGFSTLEAMVNSLAEVLESGIKYDYYNLLSAQDYPIKSNEEIYHFFSQNNENSYIYYQDADPSKWWSGAVDRFQKYHLTDFNFTGKSTIERVINFLMPVRKFPIDWKMFGGSKASWWSLNLESAIYLTNFFSNNLRLRRFLRFCWGTDEFVIPTILMNSPLKDKIVNNNLRFIIFPDGRANPKILGIDDFSDLMESSMLFARKFDVEIDKEILSEIDVHTI